MSSIEAVAPMNKGITISIMGNSGTVLLAVGDGLIDDETVEVGLDVGLCMGVPVVTGVGVDELDAVPIVKVALTTLSAIGT